MNCPKCGGPMWDNTVPGAKKSPKSPDYKCKDKECAEAVWLDKKTAKKPAPDTPAPTAPVANGALSWPQIQRDYAVAAYTAAHALARALGCAITDLDQQAVQAGAATLLIQLERMGHRLGTLAPPKPKVPKPPTPQELSEPPAALAATGDDGLPF